MSDSNMKPSTQVITCICGKCKGEKNISLLNAPIESFFCDTCKKDVTDFTTRPVMIAEWKREYNSFNCGIENW